MKILRWGMRAASPSLLTAFLRAGLAWLCVAACAGAMAQGAADAYPSRPIRLIDPYPPGSTSDLAARVLADQLSKQMGVSVIVENRPGATGTIANRQVAQAAPDGYTLLMSDSSLPLAATLYKSLPYDSIKDFTPISQVVRSPQALVVSSALNVNTLQEFIALAQANPGKYNYGSSGAGSQGHLGAEVFKRTAKVNIAHIPFKGSSDVVQALLAGDIQMTVTGVPTLLPHINSGRVRALAVTSDSRTATLPTVPTFAEAGVSGISYAGWFGLSGPAGLPKAIVDKLHGEVRKAVALPSVKSQYAAQGADPVGSTPEEFSGLIRREVSFWGDIIKASNVSLSP